MRKLSKKGYIFNSQQEIESLTYREYLETFGSDETTTGRGIAPRLYVDGSIIYSWGVNGNRHRIYKYCENKTEAKKLLYEIWEQNVNNDWNAPKFFDTKKKLFEDLSETIGREIPVLKRYFKIKETQQEQQRLSKIKHDNRPFVSVSEMEIFIKDNAEIVQRSLVELDELKQAENKEVWQVKANSLVQKVCNNDFRTLKWKEVYNLIRNN